MNLIDLCASDLDFAYPQGSRLRKLGALIINPSIRAAVLIRLVQRSPRGLFWLFRNLLITFHSIDVGPDIRIGPRLSLPHPIGIVIGNGVVIGEGCRIFQNVTIGRTKEGYPVLGDDVTVYPNSVVVGELKIEAGRRIRAGSFLAPAHRNPGMNDILTIGLDASNLREGGGLTHLVEFLSSARPQEHGIGRIVVWGSGETLAHLPERAWLETRNPPEMEQGQAARARWQHRVLAGEVRREGCDVLFSPGGNYTGDFRPFVTMSRNMLPFDRPEVARYGLSLKRLRLEVLRRLQARAFRGADGLIFLTDYARMTVLSIIGPVRGNVATIPHGVSPAFAAPARAFREIGECSAERPFELVYVSHASPYKHQWHVIEAVAQLRAETGWPLRLDLIGPRSVDESVARITKALASHDPDGRWATFHGPLPRSEVREYLTRADVGIFASSCENMPNILLEKMAAGLPIVSSDRGPMPEVLDGAGLLFDPEYPASIATALRTEIEYPTLRARHSQMAVARAGAFQWQRCADDTLSFLRQIAVESALRG